MTKALLEKALKQYAAMGAEPDHDRFEPRFIKVGQFDIRYLRLEKSHAPTLLLLNGLPQSIRMWESSIDRLSQNFDVIAMDIPGFGLSKAREEDMSPRMLSSVITQVMDYFGVEKAHVVGPDVGVPITLAAAIEQRDRIESINIFDGPGQYPPKLSPILMAVIKFRFVRWLAKGINKKAVMKTNFLTAVSEGYHQYRPSKRAVKEYYEITHDNQAHQCSLSFFASYSQDLPWIQNRLIQIKTPTLITWGELDPFVLVDNAKYLANQIPNSKLTVFPNASHFSAEDAGEEYIDLLSDWVLGTFKEA